MKWTFILLNKLEKELYDYEQYRKSNSQDAQDVGFEERYNNDNQFDATWGGEWSRDVLKMVNQLESKYGNRQDGDRQSKGSNKEGAIAPFNNAKQIQLEIIQEIIKIFLN